MSYAICFDFPDVDEPMFASVKQADGFRFVTSLANAGRFSSEDVAERVLGSYLPENAKYGVVVEVEA